MKSLKILEREHGWIARMGVCLERLIAESRSTDQLPEEASELLVLYESFADGRHQEKEEGVLFPALLAFADGRERAVLEQLLQDHGAERRHLAEMRVNLHGALYGEPLSVRAFAAAANDYMELHRAHMGREGEILFPMVERLLTPDADAEVSEGFDALEGGSGDPHGLEEQIQGLCRRIGVPMPPAA